MATEEKPTVQQTSTTTSDEITNVLEEYLELFDCLGYRYKYFMAPNAQMDWFGFQVRTPLRIHEFLLEKFGSKCRHANFDKAINSGPIESTASHMRIRHLPTQEVDLTHPKNAVPELSSLKLRAESDLEDGDVEMATPPQTVEAATSSNRVKTADVANSSADESEEYNVRKCKRMKYSNPNTSPFSYLRRIPTKKKQARAASSDDDSSDDDDANVGAKNQCQQISHNEYSQLQYLEAIGTILKSKPRHLGGGFNERPVCLRIAYRKHLINQTTQFALIIYERRDQKVRPIRSRRMLDFSLCPDGGDEHQTTIDGNDCTDAQPAVIRSNEDGEEREVIATVETPSSAEIATALEEAAFSIQPPIQRTPTKMTPIPPGTPKRRARSSQLNMSGLAPLSMTSTKKVNSSPATTPKLSAARSLRL